MNGQQIRELTAAGLFGGTLAALGIAAVLAGNYLVKDAEKRELQVRRQALEASTRLTRAADDKQQITAYLQRYERYMRMNAIRATAPGAAETDTDSGERLEWIERVVAAREARGLPRAVYSIAARRPFDAVNPPGPGLAFYASRMKLELGLVHEGDFVDYFRRLSNPPAGILMIDRCTLQTNAAEGGQPRAPSAPAQGGRSGTGRDNGNLSAVCEIDWVTLVEETPAPAAAGTQTPAPGRPR